LPSRADIRDHRGEVAAGAVAADHQPRRVDAELFCIFSDPFGRSDGVVDGGREIYAPAQPIIRRTRP